MKAYGFHGLHGRALPVACGIRSRRPDLHIFVSTGDGDCCSIGAGHWVHAVRYNMKMVLMLLDNNIYGLTKNQTSPTSGKGTRSNTHPRGSVLDPINPLQTTLGISNVSFVAQTVDWNPVHLLATLRAAHAHDGFAFVRILQRCPHFQAGLFEPLQQDPNRLLLLTHADGVEAVPALEKVFPNRQQHDPSDLNMARELASGAKGEPIGLLYRNEHADRYDEFTAQGIATTAEQKLEAVRAELGRYRI